MKRVLLLTTFLILAFLGTTFNSEVKQLWEHIFYYSPCDTPITYSIGTIDPRFNVTPNDLLEDAKIATNIWNSILNKQLFVYDPKSTFTVNMVYDSRQALTSEITKLNNDLKKKKGDIDPRTEALKQKQQDFEARVNELNNKVQYWNAQGGAPKEEYDKLIALQKALQAEAESLNEEAQRLGQSTKEYNLNAQKLNQTIDNYKQVLRYRPEEGLYEQVGTKRRISIYIDISKDEFLHTLTHEFGHALGLDHNNNDQSIMYPMTTTVLKPSKEDIAALSNICKRRLIFEVAYNRILELSQAVKERMKN